MLALLVSLVVVGLTLTIYIRSRFYEYWQRRGFPYDKVETMPFGCLGDVMRNKIAMGQAIHEVYLRTKKEPFVGINLLFTPALLVNDVDLVQQILVKDFNSFHDRGVYVNEKGDPLSTNLFSQEGKNWRNMRLQLAPCFTSGKLKKMFGVSLDVSDKMISHMHKFVPEKGVGELELTEVLKIFAVDIIASVIFGLDINSYEDPKNRFCSILRVNDEESAFNTIFGCFVFLVPKIMQLIPIQNPVVYELRDIIRETIEYREKNNVVRNDMLQLLMQLRSKGKLDDEDEEVQESDKTATPAGLPKPSTKVTDQEPLTIDNITAQGFIFYVAGQETTATTSICTIFELSRNAELMRRAQEEVATVLQAYDGQITYEALQKMDFLDRCLMETNRLYPGLYFLNRKCTNTYQIPGTDKVVEAGTPIVISMYSIHTDEDYFPNAESYDPDRFLPENLNYNKNAYTPFGEGPRHCIALRMGRMNAKLAVVKIINAFNFEIMKREKLEICPAAVGVRPKTVKIRVSRK